jgi:GPI mannosyltransferase 3
MLREIVRTIQSDRRLQWILLGGLIIQVITAITAIGASSADQHFQIIEFSLNQLGQPSGAPYVWEYTNFVRPTLQVYMFSGYHLACNSIGITDPYTQLTILRVLLGVVMFSLFNLMALYYFRNEPRRILTWVLLLMNFSWVLPYTRTLFCSEVMSSLFFFGTFFLYDINKNRNRGFLFLLLIGVLFSLTFYLRFQIASAMAAFGLWLLFSEKKYNHILPIFIGFAIGVAGNVYLDYGYYKEWVFTPYEYFYVNINAGRAAQFGTSSFTRYIGLILLVMPAPIFSFIFFYYSIKTFFKKFLNPIFLSTVVFIVAHSFVGHKEERFMFPIFNALPLIIGWSIPELEKYYAACKEWVRKFLKGSLVFTIVLNTILLITFAFVPYSQTIQFSYLLKNRFKGEDVTLHCLGQTPFQTPNGSPMVFYKNGAKNITLNKFTNIDSVKLIQGNNIYISTTYNEIKERKALFDSLGYEPVMHSSDLLWGLNEKLDAKGINTINEIWVLYHKK